MPLQPTITRRTPDGEKDFSGSLGDPSSLATARQPAPAKASLENPPVRTPTAATLASRAASASYGGVADHNGLAGGDAEFSQCTTDKPRVRFAMIDVVATRHGMDQIVDVHQRAVALQLRTLAVGRKRNPAAALRKCLKHIAHAGKGFHAAEVLRLKDLAAGFQDPLPLVLKQIGGD